MLKNRKVVYLIIVLSLFLLKIVKAAEVVNNECPYEEIYLHKQKDIQINSSCNLSSRLNFKVSYKNITNVITKISISNKYKTKIHIPKAKID